MKEDIEEKTEADTSEVEKQTKEKKTKLKGCLVFLIILALIVGGLFGAWKYLTAPESQNITLENESGQVEINGNKAQSGQTLHEGDTVKTLSSSEATISFPGGSELRLDENTQVKIDTSSEGKISIFQTLGRTWSRVINLLGVVNYEVKSSNMVASVRGTAFSTEVTSSETNVDVDESQVEASIGSSSTLIGTGFRARAKNGQKQVEKLITPDSVKNSSWFSKNRELDIKLLKKIEKKRTSLRQMLSGIGGVSPDDIAKLKSLVARSASGEFEITEAQSSALDKLNYNSPSDIARALSIIDPGEFSDTNHWTRVITTLFPLVQRFGVEKVLR